MLLGAAPAQASPEVNAALGPADAPRTELEPSAVETLPGGAVVSRFTQEVGGVPVVNAGAVVLDLPGSSPPELLFDKSRGDVPAPGRPTVSQDAAVTTARSAIGQGEVAAPASARLVIDGGELAWEVTQTVTEPLGDFRVIVDASSGDVISTRDLIRRATGQAEIFVPNAVVAQGDYEGLRDRGDRDTNRLTNLRTPVTLENIQDGQDCLKGPYVRVKVGSPAKHVCRASLDWSNVTRSKNAFEAVMAYDHIDETQQYVQSLGFPNVNDESQNVVVNPFAADNSFYLPGPDEIQFGRGGVDDAEDADVIVHEYGHAVQDAQNPDAYQGAGKDVGAQGEGFGDYLAEAYSTEVVGFDDEWSHCVMEWDATSYDDNHTYPPGICLRRTDNPNTVTEQSEEVCGTHSRPNFEIHCIGEVWSSALFSLREALGDDVGGDSVMDKVVLASQEMTPADPSFKQASQALLFADEALYGSLHCTAIRTELVDRELLPATVSC